MGFVTSLVGILARLRASSLMFKPARFRNWIRRGTESTIPVFEQNNHKDPLQGTPSINTTQRAPVGHMQLNTSLFSEENLRQYRVGGYHPVSIGDIFDGRYEVVRKLGFGQRATVWLVLDRRLNRHVALKILKAKYYRSTKSIYKVKVLQYLKTSDLTHSGRMFGIDLLDSFSHLGPHGTHICMVLEPMHQDLAILSRRSHDRKIPLVIVKEIAKQMLLALDYLHTSCSIVHTDIQPQNILVSLRDEDFESYIRRYLQGNPQDLYDGEYGELPDYAIASEHIPIELPKDPSQFSFKLSGLGVATWDDKSTTEPIQAEPFRAPEVILGAKWNSSADIWNLGCLIYTLAEGRNLFNGRNDPAGYFTSDDDHLCQIIELCGPVPMGYMRKGKHVSKYLDPIGKLVNIEQTYPVSLPQIIKYWSPELSNEEIDEFSDFLDLMLQFHPKDRSAAREILNHAWLQT